jgi:hypothetical protein
MNLLKRSALLFLVASALQSCASAELNQKLDEKVNAESDVKTRKDLDAKATGILKNTPGLTPAQRAQISELKATLQERLKTLNTESLKLRALLLEDVLAGGDHSDEIRDVKNRLRKNSQARIDTIFQAVDQANDLLGRSQLIRDAMDLQMMEDESQN